MNDNTVDNRKINLRFATKSENGHNCGVSKRNKVGIKGVSWHKAMKKWHSRIMVNRKLFLLGFFDSPEEAGSAYKEAERRLL